MIQTTKGAWSPKRPDVRMGYHFPRNRRAQGATFWAQLMKCAEEFSEVERAYQEETPERAMEEAFDLIHACEGLIDILKRDNPRLDREEIRRGVYLKNRERGDYDAV